MSERPTGSPGFDPLDDLSLARFDHDYAQKRRTSKTDTPAGRPYPGPYPILNGALNLVAGKDLAWQERKAESFVFTPKYCGYDLDRAVLEKSQDGAADAYLPTLNFYHDGSGPMLGMAMAHFGRRREPEHGPGDQFRLGVPPDRVQRAAGLVARQHEGSRQRRSCRAAAGADLHGQGADGQHRRRKPLRERVRRRPLRQPRRLRARSPRMPVHHRVRRRAGPGVHLRRSGRSGQTLPDGFRRRDRHLRRANPRSQCGIQQGRTAWSEPFTT